MKFKPINMGLSSYNRELRLTMTVPQDKYDSINSLLKKDVNVEIKQDSGKRTNTANAKLWTLCSKLAKELSIPLGDMYVKMIKRYGVFESVIVKSEVVNNLISKWDISSTQVDHSESLVDETNRFTSKGIEYVELNCFYGSSTYDKKEFSKLIEGICDECRIIGIETLSPQELKTMMESYIGG